MQQSKYVTPTQYIENLFSLGKVRTEEFQTALRVFGREKVENVYRTWKQSRIESPPSEVKDEEGYQLLSEDQFAKVPPYRIIDVTAPFPGGARYVKLRA